jgi:hypothetical protein
VNQQASKRTAHLTAFLACLVVLVALIVKDATIAGYAFMALGFLAIPPAARHAVGDLAVGGGVKGAMKVLLTDAKSGEVKP